MMHICVYARILHEIWQCARQKRESCKDVQPNVKAIILVLTLLYAGLSTCAKITGKAEMTCIARAA
jgi:hypothetical protein